MSKEAADASTRDREASVKPEMSDSEMSDSASSDESDEDLSLSEQAHDHSLSPGRRKGSRHDSQMDVGSEGYGASLLLPALPEDSEWAPTPYKRPVSGVSCPSTSYTTLGDNKVQDDIVLYDEGDAFDRKCYVGGLDARALRHGKGTLWWSNGSCYEGEWGDDVPSGYGIESYADDSYYGGAFENDERHGWGVYSGPDGSTFSGNWNKGDLAGLAIVCKRDNNKRPVIYALRVEGDKILGKAEREDKADDEELMQVEKSIRTTIEMTEKVVAQVRQQATDLKHSHKEGAGIPPSPAIKIAHVPVRPSAASGKASADSKSRGSVSSHPSSGVKVTANVARKTEVSASEQRSTYGLPRGGNSKAPAPLTTSGPGAAKASNPQATKPPAAQSQSGGGIEKTPGSASDGKADTSATAISTQGRKAPAGSTKSGTATVPAKVRPIPAAQADGSLQSSENSETKSKRRALEGKQSGGEDAKHLSGSGSEKKRGPAAKSRPDGSLGRKTSGAGLANSAGVKAQGSDTSTGGKGDGKGSGSDATVSVQDIRSKQGLAGAAKTDSKGQSLGAAGSAAGPTSGSDHASSGTKSNMAERTEADPTNGANDAEFKGKSSTGGRVHSAENKAHIEGAGTAGARAKREADPVAEGKNTSKNEKPETGETLPPPATRSERLAGGGGQADAVSTGKSPTNPAPQTSTAQQQSTQGPATPNTKETSAQRDDADKPQTPGEVHNLLSILKTALHRGTHTHATTRGHESPTAKSTSSPHLSLSLSSLNSLGSPRRKVPPPTRSPQKNNDASYSAEARKQRAMVFVDQVARGSSPGNGHEGVVIEEDYVFGPHTMEPKSPYDVYHEYTGQMSARSKTKASPRRVSEGMSPSAAIAPHSLGAETDEVCRAGAGQELSEAVATHRGSAGEGVKRGDEVKNEHGGYRAMMYAPEGRRRHTTPVANVLKMQGKIRKANAKRMSDKETADKTRAQQDRKVVDSKIKEDLVDFLVHLSGSGRVQAF